MVLAKISVSNFLLSRDTSQEPDGGVGGSRRADIKKQKLSIHIALLYSVTSVVSTYLLS